MEIDFIDRLSRSIFVKSDGLCHNIDMCNWQVENEEDGTS